VTTNYGRLAKACLWHSLYCKDPVLRGILHDAGQALEEATDAAFNDALLLHTELRSIQEMLE
jgi:hypothetical protein